MRRVDFVGKVPGRLDELNDQRPIRRCVWRAPRSLLQIPRMRTGAFAGSGGAVRTRSPICCLLFSNRQQRPSSGSNSTTGTLVVVRYGSTTRWSCSARAMRKPRAGAVIFERHALRSLGIGSVNDRGRRHRRIGAEYVFGSLDPAERRQVNARRQTDASLAWTGISPQYARVRARVSGLMSLTMRRDSFGNLSGCLCAPRLPPAGSLSVRRTTIFSQPDPPVWH